MSVVISGGLAKGRSPPAKVTGIPLSFVRYFFVLRSKFRILAGHIALPYVRESRAVENRAISAEPAALSFCDLHYNDSWETQLMRGQT